MNPVPSEIRLSSARDMLMLTFSEHVYELSAEYLRVCSPSAEVRGHGGDWKTIAGKKSVRITAIKPVGHYAVCLHFSDGHRSGIYSWEVLYDLAQHHEQYWQRYLHALNDQELSRE